MLLLPVSLPAPHRGAHCGRAGGGNAFNKSICRGDSRCIIPRVTIQGTGRDKTQGLGSGGVDKIGNIVKAVKITHHFHTIGIEGHPVDFTQWIIGTGTKDKWLVLFIKERCLCDNQIAECITCSSNQGMVPVFQFTIIIHDEAAILINHHLEAGTRTIGTHDREGQIVVCIDIIIVVISVSTIDHFNSNDGVV